jgi:phosphatidylglycerophosphate synthase
MIDAQLRRYIDPPLNLIAAKVSRKFSANQITIVSFLIGMSALPLLAAGAYPAALIVILLNRLGDGLDGAVARQTEPTDFGGYLDIVLDFIFYAGVAFGFGLAAPDNSIFAALLIFSFMGTSSSFLAFSIFAAKRNITTGARGRKSFYYLGGLTEGFETILTFVLMCLLPQHFWLIASAFSVLCWITTFSRIQFAYLTLTRKESDMAKL